VTARNKAAGILTPGYDGHCRNLGLPRGEGRALRFATPDDGVTVVVDVIRGDVEFPHGAMDDFVAVKGNGAPLFVLANVVDDIDMAITHVIRGEDLLPTTPKGILVWEALARFGWTTDGTFGEPGSPTPELPLFAHLPMLVNEARKKLSKRKDPVAVESYRDQGYLPEAFVNYLGLLGWSPPNDEAEVFTRKQMVEWFRLADVNHSPAFFDVAKLTHMNGEYIRRLSTAEFVDACQPWLMADSAPWSAAAFDEAMFLAMAPVVQERVTTLAEVPAMVDFLFLDTPEFDPEAWSKAMAGDDGATTILEAAIGTYESLRNEWTAAALHAATNDVAESVGRKLGKAQAPIRVAVTGRRVGPPLFEALEVLGPDRTLARLRTAADLVADGRTPTP
jgi:glutamyl-tRNA synthetase